MPSVLANIHTHTLAYINIYIYIMQYTVIIYLICLNVYNLYSTCVESCDWDQESGLARMLEAETEGLEVLLISCRSCSLVSPIYAAPAVWDAEAKTLLKPAVVQDGLLFQHTCDAMYLDDGDWIWTNSDGFSISQSYLNDIPVNPRTKIRYPSVG